MCCGLRKASAKRMAHSAAGLASESLLCWGDRPPPYQGRKALHPCILHGQPLASSVILQPTTHLFFAQMSFSKIKARCTWARVENSFVSTPRGLPPGTRATRTPRGVQGSNSQFWEVVVLPLHLFPVRPQMVGNAPGALMSTLHPPPWVYWAACRPCGRTFRICSTLCFVCSCT